MTVPQNREEGSEESEPLSEIAFAEEGQATGHSLQHAATELPPEGPAVANETTHFHAGELLQQPESVPTEGNSTGPLPKTEPPSLSHNDISQPAAVAPSSSHIENVSTASETNHLANTKVSGQSDGIPAGFRKRPVYRDFDLLQLAAIFFILDQLTKFLVRAYLPFGHSYPRTGFFRFTHAENTGSAFGILQGHNTPLIFVSFVGIFVLALIYQSQPRPTNLLRLSLGLQVGGALGNLIDRFRLGAVTDFIDVGPWPIFNLADASIISGLALLGWILLWPGNRNETAAELGAVSRNYQLKRRGRCACCGRYRAGRRRGFRKPARHGGGRLNLKGRNLRR